MFAVGSPRTNETLRYLGSRLVTTVLIVIGAMLLLFTLTAVVPGDPATTLLGPQATPELSRRFIMQMGLDQPLPIRLWRFFANVATGNLGVDVISGRSVAGLIGEVLPYTLILTFSALGFAALLGLRVLPTVNEYFTIKRAVDKIAASGATTVPEIRTAFDKQKDIEYSIVSITSKDLEITKVNDKVVIGFAYNKEIEVMSPVFLLIKYEGRSK